MIIFTIVVFVNVIGVLMKNLFLSFLFTTMALLVVDFVWLYYAVGYFYEPNIGTLLNEEPIMWAAILFYLIYPLGVTIIIIEPALKDYRIKEVFWRGAIFGIVAYGTYNLTNMATLKDWSSNVVVVDMIWGGLLTGSSSAFGLYCTRKFN